MGKQRKITDFYSQVVPMAKRKITLLAYSQFVQMGKQRKITDFYSQVVPMEKRKITDFPSGDMEGCSSTSAETFKHYEPSPAQHHKNYDIFLSFQGADVWKTFVDHLFNSLSTAGFRVFPNTAKLEKGKNIEVIRGDAIRNSTVYIPIFSASYARSPQCLNELSLIWTCKSTGTTIIPLFYNVQPSDVRYPDKKGSYAKAFQEHREKGKHSEEMDAWREALHQVSLLSGWSLTETAAGYKGRLVKQVVMDLLKTLDNNLDVPKHLKGLSDPIKVVTTLLEGNDHMGVGIWGMGGLGKTTLAEAVYNNIRHKFQASCFVSDVRALAKNSVKGLLKLQKQILWELAKVDEKLNTVPNAKVRMDKCFRPIKALVFLDDVDDAEQLDALVGDADSGYWFGAGSRIIITTRDSGVLKRQTRVFQYAMKRLDSKESLEVFQYAMKRLDSKESLELFSWHAFMRTGPAEGYEDVTKKVVYACHGLPLSLKVVGARLYGEKSLEIWCESLTNLVKYHKELYDTLKISYDALSSEEKRIFLDIVCFFLGPLSFPSTRYNTEFYVKLWEALELSAPLTCLKILEMNSLIRINYDRYHSGYSIFWMHDCIRDLGRQIIEESSPSNPAERSRFWRHKDFVTAMTQTQVMPNVEGLVLDFSQAEEGLHQTRCSTYPWALMPNLKFMFIKDLCREGHTNLPPNLIFLGLWSQFQEDESDSETHHMSFYLAKAIGELRCLRFLDMTGTSI